MQGAVHEHMRRYLGYGCRCCGGGCGAQAANGRGFFGVWVAIVGAVRVGAVMYTIAAVLRTRSNCNVLGAGRETNAKRARDRRRRRQLGVGVSLPVASPCG